MNGGGAGGLRSVLSSRSLKLVHFSSSLAMLDI